MKNCETCKYEPKWNGTHDCFSGECQHPMLLEVSSVPDCVKVFGIWKYQARSMFTYEIRGNRITNCQGHSKKDV